MYDGSVFVSGRGSVLFRCEVWNGVLGFWANGFASDDVQLLECKAFDCLTGFTVGQFKGNPIRAILRGCTADACDTGFLISTCSPESRFLDCMALGCAIGYNVSSAVNIRLVRCTADACTTGFWYRGHILQVGSVILEGFTASSCEVGACLRYPTDTEISNGSFNDCAVSIHVVGYGQVYPYPSYPLDIWDNNFVGGLVRCTDSTSQPNWSKDGRGNYWSAYTGSDSDQDGIGDTPYTVTTDNVDPYPLMARSDHTPPAACAGRPVRADPSEEFALDGSASADDIGIVSWQWTVHLPSGDVALTGERPTHAIPRSGDYTATLEVADAAGGRGRDWTRIHINDVLQPTIDALAIPPNAWTGEDVTLGCTASDDIIVTRAWLNLSFGPDGPWRTTNMSRTREGGWNISVWVPFEYDGRMVFLFGAIDREGNAKESTVQSLVVLDNDSPFVTMPTIAGDLMTGERRNVTCHVVDNWDMAGIMMEYWSGENESTFVPMVELQDGSSGWNGTIVVPHDDLSMMHVRFNATDTSGNWALTGTMDANVVDGEPPMIAQVMGGVKFYRGEPTVFSLNVTDFINVTGVELEILYAAGEDWNITTMRAEGDAYWCEVTLPVVGGSSFVYCFRAWDGAGNSNRSEEVVAPLRSPRPHIDPVPGMEAWEGREFTRVLSVKDLDYVPGESVWTLTSSVPWLSIGTNTGKLAGTPAAADIGEWTVEVSVTDFDGNMDVVMFNVTVHGTNFPPTVSITSPAGSTTLKGTTAVTGTASDDDGRIDWVRVRVDGGEWANATGNLTWTFELDPKGLTAGDHVLEAKAFDGYNESAVASLSFRTEKEKSDDGPGFEGAMVAIGIATVAGLQAVSRKRWTARRL